MDRVKALARRGFERWKQWSLLWKIVSVVVLVGVVFGPFVDTDSDDPTSLTTTTTAAAAATTQAVPTTATSSTTTSSNGTTSSTDSPAPLPDYTILEEEDISFATTVRISLRVVVEAGTTPEQLSALGHYLAEQYRDSHEYHAFNIFFYHLPELAHDVVTLGIWDDAPFGDWGRADEATPGDYSNFEVTEQLWEKDWSLVPSPEAVAIYVAFNAAYDAALEADTANLPDEDAIAEAVAAELGVSVERVFEANQEIFTWQFDGK